MFNNKNFQKYENVILSGSQIIVFVTSIVVIFGWILDVSVLKSISTDWVSMKFSTALSFFFSVVLFYLVNFLMKNPSGFYRISIIIPTVILVFIMSADLFNNFTTIDSPMRVLFSESDTGVGSLKKGLPSVVTQINFLLVAFLGCFSAINVTYIKKLFTIIGFVIFLTGVVSVVGYIINHPYLYYQIESISGAMALHTGILFMLIGISACYFGKNKMAFIQFKVLRREEFLRLALIVIILGISSVIFSILSSLDKVHEEFWLFVGYLIGVLIITYAISMFHRLRMTYDKMDATINAFKKTDLYLTKTLHEVKETEKLKDEFSSMVSHELKTPLTPIMLYCDLLLNDKNNKINAEQSNAVCEIQKSAEQLELLISDVLDVQKLSQGKLSLNREQVNTKDIISDTINEMSAFVTETKIQLKPKIETDSKINVDKLRIFQVLSNLIKNSIDFVSDDVGIVEVGVRDDDDNVLFYVKDNGSGIPKEQQQFIFQKFFQIDTSMIRKHGGTGLGLVICQGIVSAHGGHIWFESNLNQTIFSFTIPKNNN